MDNNYWRPTAGQGSEPHVETGGDWRTQLTPASREKVVNKIMEYLKRHFPLSGQDGLEELKKIAMHFEEKNYTGAASQNDYSRKISLKLLTMEPKSENTFPNSLPSNSSSNNNIHFDSGASLDSTTQTGHSSGCDWQEEVYQNIKAMKEMYLSEPQEMYQKSALKLQRYDSLPQRPESEQLEKLKMFKTMLEHLISLLQVSKNNITPGLKEKLGLYEKQITNFVNAHKARKPIPPLQQGHLGQPHIQQPKAMDPKQH